MDNNTISIKTDELISLAQDANHLDMLLRIMYSTAKLSWDNETLAFDNEKINVALKMLNPGMYAANVEKLKEGAANGTD